MVTKVFVTVTNHFLQCRLLVKFSLPTGCVFL